MSLIQNNDKIKELEFKLQSYQQIISEKDNLIKSLSQNNPSCLNNIDTMFKRSLDSRECELTVQINSLVEKYERHVYYRLLLPSSYHILQIQNIEQRHKVDIDTLLHNYNENVNSIQDEFLYQYNDKCQEVKILTIEIQNLKDDISQALNEIENDSKYRIELGVIIWQLVLYKGLDALEINDELMFMFELSLYNL